MLNEIKNFAKKSIKVFLASTGLIITMVLYVITMAIIAPFAMLVAIDQNVCEIGEKCFDKIIMAGGWKKG